MTQPDLDPAIAVNHCSCLPEGAIAKTPQAEDIDRAAIDGIKKKLIDLIIAHCGILPPDAIVVRWCNALDELSTDMRLQLRARREEYKNFDPLE